MANVFQENRTLSAPARDGIEVAPSDTADLEEPARALYIGTGGTLRITTIRGGVLNFTVQSGAILPWGATRVHATGTTASNIVAATF